MLVYGCLTHVELPLAFPAFVTPIYMGQAQGPGRANLRDLAPDWEPHHPVVGGTAGIFALKNLILRDHPQATRVGICQYRKFVSRKRVSRQVAPNYSAMDIVSPAAVTVERLAQWLEPGAEDFLVSRLLPMREGCLGQFASSHVVQDLLRFIALAVELGVIDKHDVEWFARETWLIPGGIELGVFPREFWIAQATALENVVRACVEQHPVQRAGYQMRVWAFCAERLGSWMLLRHFRGRARPPRGELHKSLLRGHWRQRFVGNLNLVADDSTTAYVPGTS